MQYGITKTTKYAYVGGKWCKVDSWTDAHAIIDYSHWESWRRFDSAGSPRTGIIFITVSESKAREIIAANKDLLKLHDTGTKQAIVIA